MLYVMLAIASFELNSEFKTAASAPQFKAKQAILHVPAKIFAAARRRKVLV
jgi:hypothetical protein